jgi:hypothetical protein
MIEDRVVTAAPPPGSRFKGYETFVVQDLVLHAGWSATAGNAG